MILGIVASSGVPGAVEPIPTGITQVQEWSAAASTNVATGTPITSGNLVLIRAIHRGGSPQPATVSDNGGNVWTPLGVQNLLPTDPYFGVVAGGSGDVYMWYSENVKSFSQADVTVGSGIARIMFVVEWSGVAKQNALIGHRGISNPSNRTPAAATVDISENDAGALVSGTLGATVSNRSFTLQSDLQALYVAGREHKADQSTLISAAAVGVPAGTHGPRWIIPTNESASTSGAITAAFRAAA